MALTATNAVLAALSAEVFRSLVGSEVLEKQIVAQCAHHFGV